MSDYRRFLEELVENTSFTFCSRLWAESFDLQSCKTQSLQGCPTFPSALCVSQPTAQTQLWRESKKESLDFAEECANSQRHTQGQESIYSTKSLLISQNIKIPLWKEAKYKWSWEMPRERYRERLLSLTSVHLQEEVNCLPSHMSSSPTFSFD